MPKNSHSLNRSIIVGIEFALKMADQNPSDECHTDENVKSMQTSHTEVKTKIHRKIRVLEFMRVEEMAGQQTVLDLRTILNRLNPHENKSTENRKA